MRSPLSLLAPLATLPGIALWLFVVTVYLVLSTHSAPSETSLFWQPLNEPGIGGRIDSITVSPYNANHILAGGDILGTRLSTDGGDRWSTTSGWLNYEIADFTWHPQNPDIVWAGSLSGPHISTDNGQSWTAKRTGFPAIHDGQYSAPVEKILFDPDSSHLLAFGGDHRQLKYERDILNYGIVWVSKNEGESWQQLSEIVKGGNIMAASYAGASNNEIYAAVWNRGVFYSNDDGQSWTARNQGLPVDESGHIPASHLSVHPSNANTAWVSIKGFGIYKTTDAGRRWQLLDRGIPSGGSEFWAVEVALDGQTLYAGNKNYGDRPGIYKSTNGGNSWQLHLNRQSQTSSSQKPYAGEVAPWWIEVDPTAAEVVYVGTDDAIYRSTNGGTTWTTLGAKSSEQGWQGTGFSGLVSRNIEWNPYNPNHVVLQGMDGARAIQSWNGGNDWQVKNPGLTDYIGGHDIAFAPNAIFSAFGQSKQTSELIARSQDSGRSWTILEIPFQATEATQIHVDPTDANRLWAVIDEQLWYSDNANQTNVPQWTRLSVGSNNNAVGDLEAVSSQNNGFYVATDNGIYHTVNGLDFNQTGALQDTRNMELAASPSEPSTLYATQQQTDPSNLLRYDQLTDTWSPVGNAPSLPASVGNIAVHPTNANVLALITDDSPYHDQTWATGIWISQDAGQTWQQETEGLPMLRGSAIAFDPTGQNLVVGLGGGGFYAANTEKLIE